MGDARIEVEFETGERTALNLTPDFLRRIRFIVQESESGYVDVPDFVRSALRAEVDKSEKGIFGRRRKW